MDTRPAAQSPGTRTILADRRPVVRHGVRMLATQALGMQVVGEAETWPALEHEVRTQRPDLVIVAWELVAAHEEPPLAALRVSAPDLRVVVLGLRPELRDEALTAGADDYISTMDAPDVVARVLASHDPDPGS